VNRETSTLRRMFSLAVEKRMLSRVPVFKMLEGEHVREGFVSPGDFTRLLGFFADYQQPVAEWGYCGGWRKTPIVNLQWKEIDMHSRTARLKAAHSKNGEPWVLPLAGRLWEIVEERAKARRLDCVYVFRHDAKRSMTFGKLGRPLVLARDSGDLPRENQRQTENAREKIRRSAFTIYAGAPRGSGRANRDESHGPQNNEHVSALSDHR
jgi:integrase